LDARGHEVANHGLVHLDAIRSDPITVAADFRQSRLALSNIGVRASCYRPAYGRLTLLSWLQARRHGPVVLWTHDSCDLSERPRPVSDLVADVQRDGGGIVLFHGHDRWHCEAAHDYVVEATRALLRMAREHGLAVTTCAELFGVPELDAHPVPTA
jgi:peptidoglycan/xylan/chitin deacetylase (PgdA/CDA1 family)